MGTIAATSTQAVPEDFPLGKGFALPAFELLAQAQKPMKVSNWLVVLLEHDWIIFPEILGIIIPTDFHIFQRGRSTTNQV